MIRLLPKSDKSDRSKILKLFKSANTTLNIQSFYEPHFLELSVWKLGVNDSFKHFVKSIKIPITVKNFNIIRKNKLPGFLFIRRFNNEEN